MAAAGLALALVVVACDPRLGGTQAAGENGLACESEAAVSPSVGEPRSGGSPGGAAAASPADETTPPSHFGLLTPLFPGVGSQAVTAPCQPDDFYGGCL